MGLTRRTHNIVSQHFAGREKGIAVDATCGNGFDTEFLAQLGFKKVFSFDVQEKAIVSSRQRLSQAGYSNTQFILEGHENLKLHIKEPIDCAMFNFGYLPNADKDITTTSNTSIAALDAALSLLSNNGLVTLLCYPGHPQGAVETDAIKGWLNKLSSAWTVETHLASAPKPMAPLLFVVKGSQAL
ncbi:MAG: SAM-dependent methyltransferase [Arenicella sp.]|jgi:SAM-dependent methyltransferase